MIIYVTSGVRNRYIKNYLVVNTLLCSYISGCYATRQLTYAFTYHTRTDQPTPHPSTHVLSIPTYSRSAIPLLRYAPNITQSSCS